MRPTGAFETKSGETVVPVFRLGEFFREGETGQIVGKYAEGKTIPEKSEEVTEKFVIKNGAVETTMIGITMATEAAKHSAGCPAHG